MRALFGLASLLMSAAFVRAEAQCGQPIQLLVRDGKLDEARSEAQALVNRNGSDDVALHCMGWVYMMMDNSHDAVDWFEKAVKAKENVSIHHLWLANALGDQAQHANKLKLPFLARRVKAEFDRAAQLDPTSIEAHHGLIQFYSQAPGVMGGSMEKAHDEAREIMKLNAMRGHLEMAALLGNKENDKAGAERELKAALAAAPPDSLAAAFSLGGFYVNEKRWAEAFPIYDRLIREHPAELRGYMQYARAAALSGENLERGEREMRYYLANAPKTAAPAIVSAGHYWLGVIAEKQGKKDAARAAYQTALSINPKNADAKKALTALK